MLRSPTLDMAASLVDDLEKLRIANMNRIEVMVRTDPDEDGVVRGWGMPIDHPDVVRLRDMVDAIQIMENEAIKYLQKSMRVHPLGKWVASQKGIGEKQAARLLAIIGDPYVNEKLGTNRTVGQLWSYAGLHVVNGKAPRHTKGVQSNWNSKARSRAWLIAQSCLKAGGPYKEVYDKRKAHCQTTHPEWRPFERHRDAVRVMMKEILKRMWIAARDIHLEQEKNG